MPVLTECSSLFWSSLNFSSCSSMSVEAEAVRCTSLQDTNVKHIKYGPKGV